MTEKEYVISKKKKYPESNEKQLIVAFKTDQTNGVLQRAINTTDEFKSIANLLDCAVHDLSCMAVKIGNVNYTVFLAEPIKFHNIDSIYLEIQKCVFSRYSDQKLVSVTSRDLVNISNNLGLILVADNNKIIAKNAVRVNHVVTR
ncbi:hypothetical protein [Lactobacillus apis]|uniref:Uncharacterized protein n=1 Tax=Lactobacillus apis TaxID=303541 RepID=A0A0F4LN55_9LACO|nr:hypothetical protein [Lactobacillus apis]KJY59699.1 hypothetical protein JF72_15390 [Lactobacillus apis]